MNQNEHAWAAIFQYRPLPGERYEWVATRQMLPGTLQRCDSQKLRRVQLLLLFATAALLPSLFMSSGSAAEPKRVLIVNSFGSAAPPFTVHSTSFESELVAKMGEGIATRRGLAGLGAL